MIFIIIRVIFSIATIGFAFYGLITSDYQYMSYMLFFLFGTVLLMGISEIRENKKSFRGIVSCIAAVFIFFVWLQGLFVN